MKETSKVIYRHKSWKSWLLSVIKGAIIGVGAILPGISGGVLCVVFGIYTPMMELLAHPIRSFKTHYKFFIPIIIGWALGFIGLARRVELLFRTSAEPAVWLFIGLICGTLPSLFKTAGEKGRKASAWVALGLSLAIALTILLLLNRGGSLSITPNTYWWALCGVLWGIGLIVPGMSASAMLIYLGLYQPMTAGIAVLDPAVVFPLIAGIVLCIMILSRAVHHLFNHHYAVMYHIILGFVIASTISIIPAFSANALDIIIRAACFLGGCAGAYLLDRFGSRLKKDEPQQA
jgi:putative membrane protein